MDVTGAIHFWDDKAAAANAGEMPAAEKHRVIEEMIRLHNTCALATCDLEGHVRNTPVEYLYYDGCFWIMSEGGHKFRGLAVNENVSLAIYEKYEGFGNLAGLQVQGKANMIEFHSAEYLAYLAKRNLTEEQLRKIPHPMYLIKVTPASYDLLGSALKKKGFEVRQHLEMN